MTDPLHDLTAVSDEVPSAELAAGLRTRVAAIEARAERRRRAGWHLAQLNLGVFKAPLDAPEMQPFVEALDRINELAEASPGFVWRLTDDEGGPSSNLPVPGANDPMLASNLTVWTDLESLRNYIYRTDHATYLRRRAEWFDRHREPMTVAWWIPAGTIPTLEDALRRLELLRANGPSDEGFPLARRIPPPPDRTPTPTSPTHPENPMSTQPPQATQPFVPYLTVGDARAAIDFYAEVFGAEQQGELFEMDDGRIGHAQIDIGGQLLYLADEFPEMKLRQPSELGGNSMSLIVHVDDCDSVYEHALAAGATSERAPENAHGHRIAWFVDPWGHRWSPTGPERP